MIIDFHTHIFPPSFSEKRDEIGGRDATFASLFVNPRSRLATAEQLIVAMDEAQVDMAVALGIGWTDRDMAREANDYVVRSVKRFPDRLVGFCSVNPSWGDEAIREAERCAEAGVKGIGELHPDTQGFDLGSKGAMEPLMEAAKALGLIILIHSSEPVGHTYPGKGKTTPDKLYNFIVSFPENIVVFAHWGGGLPFYTLMPEVAEALSNVYYDTAASPLLYRREIFPAALQLIGPERILFGTDFPLLGHRRLLEQVDEAPISHESKVSILSGNAGALLGL